METYSALSSAGSRAPQDGSLYVHVTRLQISVADVPGLSRRDGAPVVHQGRRIIPYVLRERGENGGSLEAMGAGSTQHA